MITLARSERSQKWTRLISQFLSGQVIIQLLNFATGFLLLRWLSVTSYAQVSVAFAFQSTLGMLIDVGFSNSIVALVGDRGADGSVVGHYIRSAKHLRNRMFVVMVGFAAVAFPLITRNQHWPLSTQILLFGAVGCSLFFQGWGMYAAPLLINGRIKEYYQSQIVAAAGRLVCCFLLYNLTLLSAWTAAWVAAAALATTGILYQKNANRLITEPGKSDPVVNREMLRYLAPLIPGVVFTAFQGQISIALITIFGHTKSIADVAALGRLGQVFFIFAAFNSVIVEPYIAKVSQHNLAKRYLLIAGGAFVIATALSLFAFLVPQPLLWLLGPKYNHLQSEVGFVVLVACVSYVAGVLWVMNSARKWLFWWYTNLYIVCVLLSQVVCVYTMRLSTTHGVILFSLITSSVILLTHIVGATYGLSQNRLQLQKSLMSSEAI